MHLLIFAPIKCATLYFTTQSYALFDYLTYSEMYSSTSHGECEFLNMVHDGIT